MNSIKFTADLPYPEIRVERVDVGCAKKLLDAYTSAASEMTAVTGYCYRSVIYDKSEPELSRIMMGIAKVEMMHLNILAKLIWLLGYDPKYRTVENGEAHFWSGEYVNYKKNVADVLKAAIEEEVAAERGYLELSRQIPDLCVRDILVRIAADERVHSCILKTELEKCMKKRTNNRK